jgi:hypothetical protein
MPLFDTLKSCSARRRENAPIARTHVEDPNYTDDALESGKAYFRLWLDKQ